MKPATAVATVTPERVADSACSVVVCAAARLATRPTRPANLVKNMSTGSSSSRYHSSQSIPTTLFYILQSTALDPPRGQCSVLKHMKDCRYCGKRPLNPGYGIARRIACHSEVLEAAFRRQIVCGRRSCDLC